MLHTQISDHVVLEKRLGKTNGKIRSLGELPVAVLHLGVSKTAALRYKALPHLFKQKNRMPVTKLSGIAFL